MARLTRQDEEDQKRRAQEEAAAATAPSGLLRSERMCMVQLIVQHDAAQVTVDELGRLGSLMFVDLNEGVSAFRRNFMPELRRCDEADRLLRYISDAVAAAGLKSPRADWRDELRDTMTELLAELDEAVRDTRQLTSSHRELCASYSALVELSHVLHKCDDIFSEARAHGEQLGGVGVPSSLSYAELVRAPSLGIALDEQASQCSGFGAYPYASAGGGDGTPWSAASHPDESDQLDGTCRDVESGILGSMFGGGVATPVGIAGANRLGFICGVVPRARLPAFERLLFRATRGNMFMRIVDIGEMVRDPKSDELVHKSVFLIFFSGERSFEKMAKIADAFGAHRYNYPTQYQRRAALHTQVLRRLDELSHLTDHVARRRASHLSRLASRTHAWKVHITKQKAALRTLNCWNYDLARRVLIAEAWCPASLIDETRGALRRGVTRSGANAASILNILDTEDPPPTYFKVNKVTAAFQDIVDTYGVPRYGEINPAAFTVVTFPFLFGVMFGDVGHGALLTLFGAYLCYFEKHNLERAAALRDDILTMAVRGRYMLLLMGVFSIYCGLLYNDVFGLMADLFGSVWVDQSGGRSHQGELHLAHHGAVYPFGIDPGWHRSANELTFGNSYKMKLSIVLGVAQMLLGLGISLVNAIHHKNEIDIWCDFVPQAIFLLSIFGYLVFCIFYKWATDWVAESLPAPSLITLLITFFMQPGDVPPEARLYEGQEHVQLLLLTLAFVSVPWMLLAKPLLLRKRHQAKLGYKTVHARELDLDSGRSLLRASRDDDSISIASSHNGKLHAEEFDFTEVMVHQVIHSIEYVLGCVSNTASYLRLWALSLAHKQLSNVFWEMILLPPLKSCRSSGGLRCTLPLFLGVAVWLVVTVAIICCMEMLSAFLHALRLHWVEFQNKFYKGDGKKFAPFSFEEAVERMEDDE